MGDYENNIHKDKLLLSIILIVTVCFFIYSYICSSLLMLYSEFINYASLDNLKLKLSTLSLKLNSQKQ